MDKIIPENANFYEKMTACFGDLSQFEQKIQSLNDEILRLEQDNANKREEIKKYKNVVEVMEL